jgi:hypothetical protein
MQVQPEPGESRILGWVTAALVSLFLGLRLPLLWIERFDPDEFEALHGSYSIASGLIPYRDYFENHLPLLHFLLLPLFRVFAADRSSGQAEALILAARVAMWGMSAATIVACYWVGRLRSGHTQGCTAAALLVGLWVFADKGFEVRPDVPAHLFLCASWLTLAAAAVAGPLRRRGLLLLGSGVCLGLATLCTQKILFSWPGCGLLVFLLVCVDSQGPRRWRWIAFWLCGLALPLVAVGAWFWAHDAFEPMIDQNLLLNLRWKTRHSPVPAFRAIWFENWPIILLAVAGLPSALRADSPRAPTSLKLLPLAAAGSLLAGTLILPAPLAQYFLPLMAPVAWLAADALVGLSHRAASGKSAEWLLAGALLALSLNPLLRGHVGRELASPDARARATLDQIGWVVDHTGRDETVLDGFSGLGVFRPHAWFYFYPNEDIRPLIDYSEVTGLKKRLRNGVVSPRLAILDWDLQGVDSELLQFLKENYTQIGTTDIWERRSDSVDGPLSGGQLEVGSGPLDRLTGVGFYPPEEEAGRWYRRSRGRASTLRVPLERADHSRLIVHARLEYQAAEVSLIVRVNDHELEPVPLEPGWRDYVLPIPASVLRPGLNRVQLFYPKAPRDTPGATIHNSVISLDYIRIE